MDMEQIAIEIMKDVCETDEVCEDMDLDLIDAGFIDSLSVISIILHIEEKLNIRLQPTDFTKEDIRTINSLKLFLNHKVK
jgi:D-alanine--poly(phosphoribitol) ligase subunit 2